jgi:hypothetical protein
MPTLDCVISSLLIWELDVSNCEVGVEESSQSCEPRSPMPYYEEGCWQKLEKSVLVDLQIRKMKD